MSSALLCPQDNLVSSFNVLCSPCMIEIMFQPRKKLSLGYFGIFLRAALKGAEKVVEAACATFISPADWDWNLGVSCSTVVSVHLF